MRRGLTEGYHKHNLCDQWKFSSIRVGVELYYWLLQRQPRAFIIRVLNQEDKWTWFVRLMIDIGNSKRPPLGLVFHWPLTRYVKLRAVHSPGMSGTFSLPLRVSDPDMHHDTCVTHVPWCMPESLTSGFLWSRWRGKRSPSVTLSETISAFSMMSLKPSLLKLTRIVWTLIEMLLLVWFTGHLVVMWRISQLSRAKFWNK